jgi:hypothetical protein
MSTYTALQADVASYLHRTDLSSGSPTPIQSFIEKARLRVARDLRSLEQETTIVLTSPTNGVFTLPTNFMELRRASSGGVPLRAANQGELDYWALSSQPAVYAIHGRNFWCPGATTVDLTYFAIEATLTSGATEHPTMAAQPQIWLYASLAEAGLYIRDFELMDRMTQAYSAEVQAVNARAELARQGVAPSMISDSLSIQSMAIL